MSKLLVVYCFDGMKAVSIDWPLPERIHYTLLQTLEYFSDLHFVQHTMSIIPSMHNLTTKAHIFYLKTNQTADSVKQVLLTALITVAPCDLNDYSV